MTLGSKLVKLRKENKLTQEQLAEMLGVSRQAVSRWESDAAYPETDKLIRISELYDCSLDYLLKSSVEEKGTGNSEQGSDNEKETKYVWLSFGGGIIRGIFEAGRALGRAIRKALRR